MHERFKSEACHALELVGTLHQANSGVLLPNIVHHGTVARLLRSRAGQLSHLCSWSDIVRSCRLALTSLVRSACLLGDICVLQAESVVTGSVIAATTRIDLQELFEVEAQRVLRANFRPNRQLQ